MSYEDYTPPSFTDELKDVPQSQEAEQALIGALLYDNRAVYPTIRDLVQPKHCYNPIHLRILEVIFERSRRGALADAIYLKNRFSQDETLKDIGGVEYMALLLDNAPPLSTAPEYAKLVAEMAGRRECIRLAQDVLKMARDPDSDYDTDKIISETKKGLAAVEGIIPADTTFITLRDAGMEAIQVVGVERPMGLPSGLSELDDKISGFSRSKLIVLAGSPSMGKTSLGTNVALNISKGIPQDDAELAPGKVGFFSQEMPYLELGQRGASNSLGSNGGVTYQDIAKHKVGPAQKERLLRAAQDNLPETFLIDDATRLTHSTIAKRARAMEKQLGGLDMIVVDYLNLMSGEDCEDPRNDVKYIAEICASLKSLAKDMNINVLLLAQLSREPSKREDGRPRFTDLKGSSGIEDAADVILLIHRREKILLDQGEPTSKDKRVDYYADLEACRGLMDVIVAKNKGGALGTVTLKAELKYDIIRERYDDGDMAGDLPLEFR